ncbi:MAG TPA: hypothetical protein VGB19_14860 [Actinomycetota bacterium]
MLAGVFLFARVALRGSRAVGLLPVMVLFWAIWPPIVAGVTIVMAIVDSTRQPQAQAA